MVVDIKVIFDVVPPLRTFKTDCRQPTYIRDLPREWGLGFPASTDGVSTRYFGENTRAWSLFGQITWYVTDELRINAGVRYTDETKDLDYDYSLAFLEEAHLTI